MLQDLYSALVLVIILEGTVLALCPSCARSAARLMQESTDERLRTLGIAALAVGVFLLYAWQP